MMSFFLRTLLTAPSAEGPIYVRRSTPDDLPAIKRILKQSYVDVGYLKPGQSLGGYPSLSHRGNTSLVAVISSGEVIGTIMIRTRRPRNLPILGTYKNIDTWGFMLGGGVVAYIGNLAIAEAYRGGPAFSLLLKAAGLCCLTRLVKGAVCEVHPKNARKYERWGFEHMGHSREVSGLDVPADCFYISLTAWLQCKLLGLLGLNYHPNRQTASSPPIGKISA